MMMQFIDVIYEDVARLYYKRGRASDVEYRQIMNRILILKKELINEGKSNQVSEEQSTQS